MIQKHTRGRKIGFDAELGFPVSEAYSMPMVLNNARAVCENASIHSTMVEFGPLLEASSERNLWSINLTLGDYPCNCLAQIV